MRRVCSFDLDGCLFHGRYPDPYRGEYHVHEVVKINSWGWKNRYAGRGAAKTHKRRDRHKEKEVVSDSWQRYGFFSVTAALVVVTSTACYAALDRFK
ncbi:MAG: hypothetical protein NTW94_05540 [Legionellales bacterium]|nr:hypothetical protein [Legionellales bacterium]